MTENLITLAEVGAFFGIIWSIIRYGQKRKEKAQQDFLDGKQITENT